MKILFLQDNGLNESLALTELSSFLQKANHQTNIFLEKEEKNDLFIKIKKYEPHLIFIPCSILAHNWSLNLLKKIRKSSNVPIVLAGTHPTFYPNIIEREDDVDIILLGEAEETTLELCEKLEAGKDITKINNLWVKYKGNIYRNDLRPLIEDLDSLPLPDRELYYKYDFIRKFSWKKFMSGRGCVNSCSFCYQPLIREMYNRKGKYVRRKSPDRIILEIQYLKNRYPLNIVHFSDDLFLSDLSWLEEFSPKYHNMINIPFSCNSSIEFLNKKSIQLLKEAGCRMISIGIETGFENYRNKILCKHITDEMILKAAKLIKEADITLVTFNMIGLPGENIEDALKTLKMNIQINANLARVNITAPIPNTKLAQYALAEGFIDDWQNDIYSLPDLSELKPQFAIKSPFNKQMLNLYYLFSLIAKFPKLFPIAYFLINLPLNRLFKLLNYYYIYQEKKIFKIGYWEGFIYYLHCGSPKNRTTNFVSLV